jgi:hypothetical protein
MKPRVCIFAAETLLHWSGYYVRAFRQNAEVIVIGPSVDPGGHDFPEWERVAPYVVRNDIHCTTVNALERMALLPPGWHPDMLVVIQSGERVVHGVAEVGCPTVYLSIDSWHDSTEFQHAHQYDYVFMAQKALVKYMRRMGCPRVFWLPLGCDPEHHYSEERAEVTYDIAFVGSTHFYINSQRARRILVLSEHFQLGLFYGLGSVEMAEAYGQSRLIFNASIACDVNMRVFEALATGRPLVTNREAEANGLFELFEDGVHLISYDDEDLVSQVQHYLSNPEAARAIGEAGREEVLSRHTYAHRVQTIFQTLREHQPDVGNIQYPRERGGSKMRDFIPYGSRRVLDVGLVLASSRVAMRRLGIECVVGVAPNEASQARRGNSYDTMWIHGQTPTPTGDFDVIAWGVGGRSGVPIVEMLTSSRAWLVSGGRMLFAIGSDDLREAAGVLDGVSVGRWMGENGCQLLRWFPPEGDSGIHVIVATPLLDTFEDLRAALYREFPLNGVDTEPWKNASAPVSDSPDVVNP